MSVRESRRMVELESALLEARLRERQAIEASDKLRAEVERLRAERDTMLLDTRDFVSWFNRHYQDPSYNLDHPWCVINARLDAYADTLAAIDAARGQS